MDIQLFLFRYKVYNPEDYGYYGEKVWWEHIGVAGDVHRIRAFTSLEEWQKYKEYAIGKYTNISFNSEPTIIRLEDPNNAEAEVVCDLEYTTSSLKYYIIDMTKGKEYQRSRIRETQRVTLLAIGFYVFLDDEHKPHIYLFTP